MVQLKALYYLLAVTVLTTVLFFPAVLSMVILLDAGASIYWARVWSKALLWVGDVRLEVAGRENVDPNRPTIYVSNHTSAADIPILFVAIPVNVRYVAKKQLAWVPVIGWYLMLARYILVDRGNRARAIASLDKAGEKIRGGVSIIVYPEGTRSTDGRIHPFKKGPFALALKARVPICPVTIVGAEKILLKKGSFAVTRGVQVKVKIGTPIAVDGYDPTDREKLAHDIREVMIRQSLELGGLGGDVENAVASIGYEGVSDADRRRESA